MFWTLHDAQISVCFSTLLDSVYSVQSFCPDLHNHRYLTVDK